MRSLVARIRDLLVRGAEIVWSAVKVSVWIAALLFVLWCSGSVTSVSDDDQRDRVELVPPDTTNPIHRQVVRSLQHLWSVTPSARGQLRVALVSSPDLNAASLGKGRFVVWEGLGELPRPMIDAVMAHEVAHDVLRHGRDRRELDSVTDFAGEVLSLFLGGGPGSEERYQGWVDKMVVPSYSRAQEAEADAHAVQILGRAGYTRPDSVLAETLSVILDQYGDRGGGFFDTHPATSERVKEIRRGNP